MAMCGGLGEEQTATDEVQALVDQVRPALEAKIVAKCAECKAVKYRTQVVAGVNYFVKVSIGGGKYLHLRIFKPLPHTGAAPELSELQQDKSEADPIEFF